MSLNVRDIHLLRAQGYFGSCADHITCPGRQHRSGMLEMESLSGKFVSLILVELLLKLKDFCT